MARAEATQTTTDAWTAQTIRNLDDFAALAPEWEALWSACGSATAFQSYAWLDAWWRAYGDVAPMRVVIVRHDGRLVFAAPLALTRHWGFSVLAAAGGDLADLTDFLIADDHRHMAPLLAAALRRRIGVHPVELPETPPDAAAWLIARAWPSAAARSRVWLGDGMACLELPGESIDKQLARLPKPTAKQVRKKLRRIDEQHITVRRVESLDSRAGIETLLRLHERQWQGRGINPEHTSARFATFLAAAAPAMIERGQAHLLVCERGGEPVMAMLLVVGQRLVGEYLNGVDPSLRNIDVSVLYLREDLALTESLGKPAYSMLRGIEPHKLRFLPREVRNRRLLLTGGGPAANAYTRLAVSRDRTAALARRHLPRIVDAARQGRAKLNARRQPPVAADSDEG